LYFNGRASGARFYLTFLVGSARSDGRRAAGVRLQLDRGAGMETFSASEPVTDAAAMRAPDLAIGASSVRLDGMRYVIHLDLRDARGRRARADLSLEAAPGRLLPPLEIAGVRGWRTGYVVPVMSGKLDGQIAVDGRRVPLDGGTGYHDHNWGFWKGVSWQWGQVQQNDLSVLYGRVFPPPGAADPERLPGFVGVLGPDGPIGYTTDVTIAETNDARGNPQAIAVRARGAQVDLSLIFSVESAEVTRGGSGGPAASGLDFYQLRGTYNVDGRAGSTVLAFAAPGSAETFRGR
ncbi:MAG: hypothetical protein HY824_16590, partial [Acidobacteria bacterium]|nr:hypothetical protein [Acidobacteriota bacterium]